MKKDFITIAELETIEVFEIFDLTFKLKKDPLCKKDALKNKTVGLIFQKPSNRTRVSFEVASVELGAVPVYLGPDDIELGKREPIKDIARVLSRYINLAVLRTFSHDDILEFAEYATIPVINGLSDLFHPCQALGDIFTIKEKLGTLKDKALCFVGDGNNVLHSLLYCSSKVGLNLKIATPKGYEPDKKILANAKSIAKKTGSKIELFSDPKKAAKDADVIYSDVWVSMGQEKERSVRLNSFKGFQINSELINLAKKNVIIMHCLPAHRGEEITDEAIESKKSVVFDQAENLSLIHI